MTIEKERKNKGPNQTPFVRALDTRWFVCPSYLRQFDLDLPNLDQGETIYINMDKNDLQVVTMGVYYGCMVDS